MTNGNGTDHIPKMRLSLQNIGILFGILIPLMVLASGWAVNSYRITLSELAITSLRTKAEIDHEILIQIREQVIWIKLKLDEQ